MHVEVIEGMCTRMHEALIPGRRRAHVSLDQSNLTGSGGVRLGLRLASAAAVNNTPRLPPTGRCVLPRPLVRGGRRCEAERGPPSRMPSVGSGLRAASATAAPFRRRSASSSVRHPSVDRRASSSARRAASRSCSAASARLDACHTSPERPAKTHD